MRNCLSTISWLLGSCLCFSMVLYLSCPAKLNPNLSSTAPDFNGGRPKALEEAMGMHFMVLAKLNMTTGGHSSGLAPVVASLVWPFILKLSFGLRPLQQTSTNLLHSSRLFFFQLNQIVFNAEPNQGQGSRFERAVRLVYQRFGRTTRPSPPDSDEDEDSLHTLSMIAL